MAMQFRPKPEVVQRAALQPEVKRPAERLMDAAREMVAIAKGEAEPASVHVRVGRPPSGKVRVTMLLDPAVIAKFKATGDGWQARINDVLKGVKV